MTTTNTPERATARKWFWSGDSLMEDWPDKGCSHHILHARKDGTLFVEEGAQERIIESVNTHDALQAENERLREQVKELLEALEPFARYFELNDCESRYDDNALEIPIGDLRRARALLNPQEPNNG